MPQQFRQAPANYGSTISKNIIRGITFFSLPALAAGQSNATTMSLDTYMHNFYIVSGVSVGIFLLSSCIGCIIKNAKHCKRQRDLDAEDDEVSLGQLT
jgi:hypothetical protein